MPWLFYFCILYFASSTRLPWVCHTIYIFFNWVSLIFNVVFQVTYHTIVLNFYSKKSSWNFISLCSFTYYLFAFIFRGNLIGFKTFKSCIHFQSFIDTAALSLVFRVWWKSKIWNLVTQSHLTLATPHQSPSGSPVHGIHQPRTLSWLPFPSPIPVLSF